MPLRKRTLLKNRKRALELLDSAAVVSIVRRDLQEHLEVKATDDVLQDETADMRVSTPDRLHKVTIQLEGDIEQTIMYIDGSAQAAISTKHQCSVACAVVSGYMKDGKFNPQHTYTQALGDCTEQHAELHALLMALEHMDPEQMTLIVCDSYYYLNGLDMEVAETPFDVNEFVTVLQDFQQLCDDNTSASAASLGIRDVPVTSTGWIPKVEDLVREKIAVKKEFGPSYRAPVPVLGIHNTRAVILPLLPGSKENRFPPIDNVKLHHMADPAQQT
ncbi:hypothetical protein NDU88_005096 [Pleurodeles waltl]|uniref:RNase H type-1 domain-containing protein n=1 Tax=Pleurodeles waltl TaxID=8319 RepID=A0AAV7M891_PLEWA|nr:hypothetical protein NDU88_005096 [Pleurodeles waltl]